MTLTAGTRLGPFEIVAPIGAGGMGEVYRARDIRLARDVALKVLPQGVASNPERLSRFRREAQVLAALNHPNIAAIYGLEEPGLTTALVLELVEGPTLADRLRGGALPLEEALPIARQVAEALEAAHEKGILHRDLKPANIKVTPAGQVKVLDFGLAKMLGDDSAAPALANSPTMMTAVSEVGVILGTAAYMSPEQARGKAVDRRADVWAFGAVLFEVLSGRRAFDGDTLTDVMGAILHKEPNWRDLPAGTPLWLLRLARRCLAKDARQRLHDIADARVEIEAAEHEPQLTGMERVPLQKPRWLVVAAAIAGLLVGGVAMRWIDRGTPSEGSTSALSGPLSHTVIDLAGAPLALGSNIGASGFDNPAVAISPTGTHIVYVGRAGTGTMLYVRNMATTEVRPIAGSEGAVQSFFKPDGLWIGFLTNDKVKKVSLQGDTPVTLCDASVAVQGWWAEDGFVYFSQSQGRALSRVPQDGGKPDSIIDANAIRTGSAWRRTFSDVLPDGKYAIVTAKQHGISDDYSDVEIVSTETLQTRTLVRLGYGARYVPPGFILFARGGSLYAVRFDPGRQEILGEEVSVVAGVAMESLFGQVHAAVSSNGLLVFVPGGDRTIGRLAWVDRKGGVEFLKAPSKVYGVVHVSPNGKRLAVHVADVTDYIWIYDLERSEGRRLTASESQGWPVWAPDNLRIALASITGGNLTVHIRGIDDAALPEKIASGPSFYPTSWLPNGKALFITGTSSGKFARFDGTTETADTKAYLSEFSPDGRWLAYASTQTGQYEIWVRSYPDEKGDRQISIEGGFEPVWCPCGELFYRNGSRWFSTKIRTTPELQWETPRLAFETDFIDTPGISYDISPDGRRLLVVKRAALEVEQKLHVVTNWHGALEARN
jgi:serine/threonine-protein kinase